MNIQEARTKFPQYEDLSDEDFARGLHKKFYADMPYEEFSAKLNLTKPKVAKVDQRPVRDFLDPAFDFLKKIGISPEPEAVAADPLVRLAVGAGKETYGATQLFNRAMRDQKVNPLYRALFGSIDAASKSTGATDDYSVGNDFKETEAIARRGLGDKYDIASVVGSALNPVSLKYTSMLPVGAKAITRVAQGAGAGAVYGATSPSEEEDFWEDKAIKAAGGAIVGAAMPGIIEGVKSSGSFLKKLNRYVLSPNAAKNTAYDYWVKILGRENIPKLVEAAKDAKEIVPGSRPTTAEAVSGLSEGSPIIALQGTTASTPGGISARFGARVKEQEAARESWLRSFFGDENTLKVAQQTADDNAKAAYGPLMGRQISPQSDVDIFLRNIQERRGVPWTGSSSDVTRATPNPRTGNAFGGGQEEFLRTATGRAGALQAWGKSATDEAQNRFAANNWYPVAGQPRVSPRYSPRTEVADQAQVAMRESLGLAQTRGKEAEFVEQLFERMSNNGKLAEKGFAEFADRPSVINAVDFARKLASEGKYKFPSSVDDNFSVQNLHDIKLGIDAQIKIGANKNHPAAMDESMLAKVSNTKGAFIDWLESKVPEYGDARTQFAKDMTVVDRQNVGQALIDKLRTVTGQESPGTFLRAVDDEAATIKKLTGQPRFTMDQLFNPVQRNAITRTVEDLERKLASTKPAQTTKLGGSGEAIASGQIERLPSLLKTPFVVANWMLSKLAARGGKLESAVDEINAQWLLNPKAFAQAFEMLPPDKKAVLAPALRKKGVDVVQQGMIGPAVTGMFGD